MPQFVAKPVLIEAHQYQGHTLNMDGAFNAAFLSYVSGSTARVWNEGVPCELRVGDWLARGRDGVVRIVRQAVFEASYELKPATPHKFVQQIIAERRDADPEITPERVKRKYTRKEHAHV